LQDKLKGRSVFQPWETERLAQLKEQLITNLLQEKGIYELA
jgi:3-methyladenine DNA glycosylase Tag